MAIGQQAVVALPQPCRHRGLQAVGAGVDGPLHRTLGVHQQLGHAGRPALPRGLGDGIKLTQVVGVAQRVGGGVVAPVGRPAIMDGHAGKARQHPSGVHRRHPPLGMDGVEREFVRGGRMDPVQPPGHPGAGLVDVDDGGRLELLADGCQHAVQATRALGHHRGQAAGGDRGAQAVGQQLGAAVIRQVLMAA